jgi:RNA polymerase sigma factor (sigma-70 family)
MKEAKLPDLLGLCCVTSTKEAHVLASLLPFASTDAYLRGVASLNVPVDHEYNNFEGSTERIELVVDPTPSLYELHEQSDRIKRLAQFMEELSPSTREIVHRHFWLDESQSDIAKRLGISRSAVCHALAAAYKKGRKFYGAIEH